MKKGLLKDIYFYPKHNNPYVFIGKTTIPKTAKNGYWSIEQINIYDDVGNRRSESAADFGFRMFVNNAQEDVTAPEYVPNSLSMTKTESEVASHSIHNLNISWDIIEEGGMKKNGVLVRLVNFR